MMQINRAVVVPTLLGGLEPLTTSFLIWLELLTTSLSWGDIELLSKN